MTVRHTALVALVLVLAAGGVSAQPDDDAQERYCDWIPRFFLDDAPLFEAAWTAPKDNPGPDVGGGSGLGWHATCAVPFRSILRSLWDGPVDAPDSLRQRRANVVWLQPEWTYETQRRLFRERLAPALGLEFRVESRPSPAWVLTATPDARRLLPPARGITDEEYENRDVLQSRRISVYTGTIRDVTRELQSNLGGLRVIDETGLDGEYSVVLDFEPGEIDYSGGLFRPTPAQVEIIRRRLLRETGLDLSPSPRPEDWLVIRYAEGSEAR